MKTVEDIKSELEGIKKEMQNKLNNWLKNNPDISISINFSTESEWVNLMNGGPFKMSKEIKSELNITID